MTCCELHLRCRHRHCRRRCCCYCCYSCCCLVLLSLSLLSLQLVLFANPPKSSNRRFLQTTKKRQIGGVNAIFHVLGTKNTVNTDVFGSSVSAKPRYLRGFEPLLAKITVFTVFCGPGLAKTLVFTQFPACCHKLFLDAKGTKTL